MSSDKGHGSQHLLPVSPKRHRVGNSLHCSRITVLPRVRSTRLPSASSAVLQTLFQRPFGERGPGAEGPSFPAKYSCRTGPTLYQAAMIQ